MAVFCCIYFHGSMNLISKQCISLFHNMVIATMLTNRLQKIGSDFPFFSGSMLTCHKNERGSRIHFIFIRAKIIYLKIGKIHLQESIEWAE
jgi:hypothetical protein